MTSEILTEAIESLDHYCQFDRATGRKPFLLMDGHGSRLQLSFLKYMSELYVSESPNKFVVSRGLETAK